MSLVSIRFPNWKQKKNSGDKTGKKSERKNNFGELNSRLEKWLEWTLDHWFCLQQSLMRTSNSGCWVTGKKNHVDKMKNFTVDREIEKIRWRECTGKKQRVIVKTKTKKNPWISFGLWPSSVCWKYQWILSQSTVGLLCDGNNSAAHAPKFITFAFTLFRFGKRA